MPHVFSTMSSDVHYHVFEKQDKSSARNGSVDVPKKLKTITIKGGAGVATKRLETPLGVVTSITDEELEILEADETFQTHSKGGFISVQRKKQDVEVVVADMMAGDDSAPITPADGLEGDANTPEDNKAPKKDRSFKVKNNLE